MKKILLIYTYMSPFIKKDLEILKENFDVKTFHYETKGAILRIRQLIKLFFKILKTDLVYHWFCYEHALIGTIVSKCLHKKSIIVVGGSEVTYMPEIDYGLLKNKFAVRMVRFSLKHADKVIAVSNFTKKEILRFVKPKDLKAIYNGIDPDVFKPAGKKENIVVTAGLLSEDRIKLKGLDTFIESAKRLPNIGFVIIGPVDPNYPKPDKTPNIKFTGYLPQMKVLSYYQRAKVYCQLSYYESFGMALAEAMACECIPVITKKGSLPEVVGDTGFYVSYGDTNATVNAIRNALKSDKGKKARERIKKMFLLEKRNRGLVNEINDLLC